MKIKYTSQFQSTGNVYKKLKQRIERTNTTINQKKKIHRKKKNSKAPLHWYTHTHTHTHIYRQPVQIE